MVEISYSLLAIGLMLLGSGLALKAMEYRQMKAGNWSDKLDCDD